jgi:hypothetical protein
MVRVHPRKLQSMQQGLVAVKLPPAAHAYWKTCTATARPFFFPLPLTNTATKHPIQIAASNIRNQCSPLKYGRMGVLGYIQRRISHWVSWICSALVFNAT